MLHDGPPDTAPVIVAWKGKESEASVHEEIVELMETADLTTPVAVYEQDAIWDEWDM